jgi:hypothetical protein
MLYVHIPEIGRSTVATNKTESNLLSPSFYNTLCGSKVDISSHSILLVATSFGRLLITSGNVEEDENRIESVIPSQLENQLIIHMAILNLSTKNNVIMLIGVEGKVVILSETSNHFLRTRRYDLGHPITSATVVNHHIIFISGGIVYICGIECDETGNKGIMLNFPEKVVSSPRALGLASTSSNLIFVYMANNSIVKLDLKSRRDEGRTYDAAQKISGALSLLSSLSEEQESLKCEESRIDELIQHLNLAIHVGSLKKQFTLRISPKIESHQFLLSITLSPPPYIQYLRYWSITLNFTQSDQTWSHSIPLEGFLASSNSKMSSSLSFRLHIPQPSLHPMNVRAFVCFHTSMLLPMVQEPKKSSISGFLQSSSENPLASFLIGEYNFDALDMLLRTKHPSTNSVKNSEMSFRHRLRRIMFLGNQHSRNLANPSPLTMDLNFGVWTFSTWMDWKAIPEEVLISIFGNILRSVSTSSIVGASKSNASSYYDGVQTHLETSLGNTVSIKIRPVTASERSSNTTSTVAGNSLVCACTIHGVDHGGAEEIRSAIVSRIASKLKSRSGLAIEHGSAEEITMMKSLGRSLQSQWKEIQKLEDALNSLKSTRVQYFKFVRGGGSYPLNGNHVTAAMPSFLSALDSSKMLVNELKALYYQLRQLLAEKHVF